MAGQLDLVITTVTSAFGTSSNIPLGAAASVNGVTFMSFVSVGATATSYDYSILDTGNTEIGTATYRSSDNVLTTRTPTKSTNGGAAIAATSAALITCTLRAETANTFINTIIKQSALSSAASSGTYTPSTGMVYALVEMVGGGGGAGGVTGNSTVTNNVFGGGGGGSGGYSRLVISSTYGAQTFVLGAGGAGGSSNGSAGGDTVFGSSLCTAKGGAGGLMGNGSQSGLGGAGGVAGTGDLAAAGAPGASGIYATSNLILFPGGTGGASHWGGGAAGPGAINATAVAGINGGNYGGGGSGAVTVTAITNASGGSGSYGALIITDFCRQ